VSPAAFWLEAREVAEAMDAQVRGETGGRRFASVSIDSRTTRAGDLFFAIKGPRFDGHAFLGEVIARGAAGIVVSEPEAVSAAPASLPVFAAGDTVAALQSLARHVRRRSRARVVAITGSTGKTTTKEVTAALLELRYRTMRNRGNLNNHIGLPLSLMELTGGSEIAVLELGMNHTGEIRRLVSIAEPEVRVWTNVGTAHLEYFGTEDAIAEAKAEIVERAGRETVFVANADDARVIARAAGFPGRVLSFAIEHAADVRAAGVEDGGFDGIRATVSTPAGTMRMASPLPGVGNLLNVLAATAVAVHFDVPVPAVAERIGELRAAPHRGEVRRLGRDVTLVDDCYNSSPGALRMLLATAGRDPSGRRRVAFLGEMLELGAAAPELHRACGRAAAEAGIAALVTVGGPSAERLGDGALEAGMTARSVRHVTTSEQAADLVPAVVAPGDLVLVKGSRGVRMELVVERLEAEFA
jgi:UDP-N-acetylmuramoyl-tripeptide--D-alanyl-D-alanine ligase